MKGRSLEDLLLLQETLKNNIYISVETLNY